MRKFTQQLAFVLVTLLCCVNLQVKASELTVAENATGNTGYLPIYGLYVDTQGAGAQSLYPANELSSMVGGAISQMTFYLSTSAAEAWTGTIQVSLAEVTETSLASAFYAGEMTTVYTGTLDASGETLEVVFSNPFTYAGGNLLVDMQVSVAGNWKSASFTAVAMEGAGRYRTSASAAGSVVNFLPKCTFTYTPGSSGGPTCETPASLDITGVTAHEATLTWAGGGSAVYNVEYQKAGADKWTTALEGTSLTTTTLQNLEANTKYNVRVNCVCGENFFSGYKSGNFTTPIALPYGENFDEKTAFPSEWKRYSGVLIDDVLAGTDSLKTVVSSGWNFINSETGVFESKHMYVNIWSTYKYWVVLPSVPIDNNVQLTFTMALSKGSAAYTPIATTGVDDKFVVLASVDDGATWSVLRQWDNAGSAYVYNNIALYGEDVTIDLSPYAGQSVKIAFYGGSTTSNADNYLHIDDVLIGYVPSCLKPSDLHEVAGRTTKNSTQVAWTANSSESNWRIQYKKKAAKEWQTLTNVTENPYTLTGLQADTVYSIRVAALCDPTDTTTLTDYTKPITVKTAAGVPYAEPFSASTLPADWKRYKGNWELVQSGADLTAVTTGWATIGKTAALGNGVYPDSAYHLKLNVADSTCNYWLVSPTISMEAGYQLSFYLALTRSDKTTPTAVTPGEQNDDKFIVGISQDGGASWNVLREWNNSNSQFDAINATANGQLIRIPLDAYAGQNVLIAFYGESTSGTSSNNLHISGLKIATIPACENSTALDVTGVAGTTATLQWDNVEGAVWQYFYRVKQDGEFTPTDAMFVNTTGERSVTLTGLQETTAYTFYLRKQCGDTYSEILSRDFTTIQSSTPLPYSQDFESGNGWYLINGDLPNKWAWGEAVNKTQNGSRALYISNDNGLSNKYTTGTGAASMVYATKTFYFDEVGMYQFQYDWRAYGYSTSDYLRVALVPLDLELKAGTAVPTGFSSSALPADWTALDGGNKLNLDSVWKTKTVELAINTVGYYKVVFAWRNIASSSSKNPPAAIDNIKIFRIACPKPINLEIADLSASGATIIWNDETDVTWEYACVLDTAAVPTEFTPVAVNTVALTGLTECTSYKFYLRKVCGEDYSEVVSIPFQTSQTPVVVGKTFTDGFENGGWIITNGDRTNKWVMGTAVHNGEGSTRALYISDNNGVTNTYTNEAAIVYATKTFTFTDASYIFQYDWKAWGEGNYDYIRVALVSPSTTLTAGSTVPSGFSSSALPTGWKALDGGTKLNIDSLHWNTFTTGEIELTAGDYMVVFAWRNDGSGGYNPPGAVDNFSIRKVLCATPANLSVDSVTTNAALLKWEPQAAESTWLIRYKESGAANWADSVQVASDSTWLANLEPSKAYEVQVAAWCDPTDEETISEFTASVAFATECVPFDIVNEHFDSLAVNNSAHVLPVCWDLISTSTTYDAYPTAYNTEKAYSASNAIYFLSRGGTSYDAQDEYLILPEMTSLDGMRLKFQARKEDETDEDITIKVGVMTDKTDTATFVVLDAIPMTSNVYSPVVVPFTGYTGTGKYIAIMMPAAVSSWATLLIDNVVVEEIPQCVEPSTLHVDTVTSSSVLLRWSQQGSEENWLIRYKKSGAEAWVDTIQASTDSLLISGLKKATAYEVQIAAWCDLSDEEAVSPFSGSVIFTTDCGAWSIAEDGNYTEGFEAYEGVTYSSAYGVVPVCWDATTTGSVAPHVIGSGSYYWKHSGTKALTFYGSGYCYAALPKFEEPLHDLQISFWMQTESATNGTLTLGYITDANPTLFHEIEAYANNNGSMAYRETLLNAVPDSAARLVFRWYYSGQWSCCIDDIEVSRIPTCLKPTGLKAVLTPVNGSVATLNWKPGKNETAWAVEYSRKANFSDSIRVVAQDSTLNLTGLMSDSTYYARVKAVCSDTDESAWSDAISFTPTDALIINDSTATNSYVPFYGYYVHYDVKSQFVIPASDLQPIVWDSITRLTFYSSTATAALTGSEFEVYMAPMDTTVISAEKSWDAMEKVMNKAHLSIANNKMVVTLSEPYQYQGGNLLIGFKLAKKASSSGTTAYFYGKTGKTGASIGGYASSATGTVTMTQRNFLPKMRIDYVEGEEPSCMKVTNLKVSGRTATSAVIGWTNGDTIQSAWQIAYSTEADFNPATVTPLDVQSNPYSLSELLTDTAYYVYVRANCGEDGYSQWSKPISFRTAKACQTPDKVKADSISTTSALISWDTYGQTGFNLAWTDGINADTIYNVACPYLLDSLKSNTSYRVKVQVACEALDSVWSSQYIFKTAYGIPFEEKFATTTIPSDWSRYSGLMNEVLADSATLTEVTAIWNFGTYNGVFDNHAYINIYGSSRYHWLVTPKITVVGNTQLTFDLALTKYSGTLAEITKTLGQDDRFAVLISTDNGAHWSVLREWNNTGSAYVYNDIATAGEPVDINLSAYNGMDIKLAFYGESTVSETNSDNNLHVDNVLIDLIPSCLKPKKFNVSDVKAHTAKLSWTAGDSTQTAWQIAYDTLATTEPDSMTIIDVTTNPYVLGNLDPSTTYYAYVRANCGDEDGLSKWSDMKSFTTTVACPAPANLKAKLTPGNGSIATLFWQSEAESYTVQYSLNRTFTDSIETVVTDTMINLTGLLADTTYYARVKADCGTIDSLSVWSSTISFTPTNIYSLTVNEGTTTNQFVPVYGYYVDNTSLSQFIIPAEQLEEILWDTIQQLTFYASNANVNFGNARFQVYMAETDETSISALGDWSKLNLVADSATLSIVNNQMVVDLPVPYWYQGDNLVIGFKQIVKGSATRTYWYGAEAQGASFAGYQGTGNPVLQQRNFLPKTMFIYAPGQAPACVKPRHVKVTNITDYKATAKWDSVPGAIWQYALIASDTLPAEADFINVTGDSIAFDNLMDGTNYVFYLRKFCGEDGNSETIAKAFATPLHVEDVPFEDNFEDKSAWKLINGTSENAWVIGNAATAEGKSLYISNNGGASNAYTFTAQTAVYATMLLNFEESGNYNFVYDWKANGEYDSDDNEAYDYLRVALAPATAELEAGLVPFAGLADTLLPAGWIALDGGHALVESTQWKRERHALDLAAGQYKVVFAWINDNESGNNMPAAIDNFSVKDRHCNQPTQLTASNIMPTSATLSWSDGEDEQRAWQLAYSTEADFNPDSVLAIDIASNPYVLAGLTEATTYYVSVRVSCGEDDYSFWSEIQSFTTEAHCEVIAPEVQDTICVGSEYTWNGKVYTEAGTYKDTLFNASAQGCDSIVTLVLSYYGAEDTIYVADTIRQDELPYRYKAAYIEGQVQISYAVGTALGVYVDTALVQGEHCAAVLIHTLTIEHAICETVYADPENVSICAGDSYVWHGKHYSIPATYYDTTQNMFGCDSVFSLTISYYAPEDTLYAADTINEKQLPYTYRAQYIAGQAPISYAVGTKPGVYVDTVLVQGVHCAAALIHTLVIEQGPCETVVAETENDTICLGETYTWNGKEYAAAGLYYDTLTTAAGCDSIASLQLSFYAAEDTIRVADSISQDELPYTYEADYIADQLPIHYDLGTEAGVYVDTALVQGEHCPAVLILTLTINKSQGFENIYGRDGKRVQKLIYNDQMYILVDDEWYTAAGQKVSNPRK